MDSQIKDLEARIRALENKVWLAVGFGLALTAWLGVTSFYSIPTAVEKSVNGSAAKEAENKIDALLEKARKDAAEIAAISKNGTIIVAGTCFKPQILYRCGGQPGGNRDHVTWWGDASECQKVGYATEGRIAFLAGC